jgi:hypothetical protein
MKRVVKVSKNRLFYLKAARLLAVCTGLFFSGAALSQEKDLSFNIEKEKTSSEKKSDKADSKKPSVTEGTVLPSDTPSKTAEQDAIRPSTSRERSATASGNSSAPLPFDDLRKKYPESFKLDTNQVQRAQPTSTNTITPGPGTGASTKDEPSFTMRPSAQSPGQTILDFSTQPKAPARQDQEPQPGLKIKKSGYPARGLRVNDEHPAIQTIEVAPANNQQSGDLAEFVLNPSTMVTIHMPTLVDTVSTSMNIIEAQKSESFPHIIFVKIANQQGLENITPVGMHIIDTQGDIYTFRVLVTAELDLDKEYPSTIIIKQKIVSEPTLVKSDYQTALENLIPADSIIMLTGGVPKTQDFHLSMRSSNFKNHMGYITIPFLLTHRANKKFNIADLTFTFWVNGEPIAEGLSHEGATKNVFWQRLPSLTDYYSRYNGYQTEFITVKVRASTLEIENWQNNFVTIHNKTGYSRFDFEPMRRSFRAPISTGGGN